MTACPLRPLGVTIIDIIVCNYILTQARTTHSHLKGLTATQLTYKHLIATPGLTLSQSPLASLTLPPRCT